MIDLESFKRVINKVKFESNLRQSDIAIKLGVSPTYLSDMLNGRVPVTDNILENIYSIFPFVKDDQRENILNELSDKVLSYLKAKTSNKVEEDLRSMNVGDLLFLQMLEKIKELEDKIEGIEMKIEELKKKGC